MVAAKHGCKHVGFKWSNISAGRLTHNHLIQIQTHPPNLPVYLTCKNVQSHLLLSHWSPASASLPILQPHHHPPALSSITIYYTYLLYLWEMMRLEPGRQTLTVYCCCIKHPKRVWQPLCLFTRKLYRVYSTYTCPCSCPHTSVQLWDMLCQAGFQRFNWMEDGNTFLE